jgi:peptide/nickel transport system ATP-binding protein
MSRLLTVDNLQIEFATSGAAVYPVQGAGFAVETGECLCLVGESGCGKSVSMMAVMGLLPSIARVQASTMEFAGVDLLRLPAREFHRLRGPRLGMIFQDAMSSFNPVLSIGDQLAEPLRQHKGKSRREAMNTAIGWLERVGIANAAERARQFPHQFSGGMLQRAMIAMALICEPQLVIADEPTTALDVSVQAEILAILRQLQREQDVGLIMITHDLGVVSDIADRVAVMYAGTVVETASARQFFANLSHPYSKGLLACTPNWRAGAKPVLPIVGQPPLLTSRHDGCPFRFRCSDSMHICATSPPWVSIEKGHLSRCFLSQQELCQKELQEPRGVS